MTPCDHSGHSEPRTAHWDDETSGLAPRPWALAEAWPDEGNSGRPMVSSTGSRRGNQRPPDKGNSGGPTASSAAT